MSSTDAAPPPAVDGAGHYGVLALRGRDAGAFLQGQLTRDVPALGDAELGLCAILTPQGRVVAAPWLARAVDGYDLLVPAALVAPLKERLQRFVLRAKVTLAPGPAAPLVARLAATLGVAAEAPAAHYALALIRAGVPEVGLAASEAWIPQMLNLDLLGAIGFQKGCYTGQEIVARTQHLGRIKRRLFRFALAAGAPPAALAALLADGAKVGEVVLAAPAGAGAECLAVLNLDARERALALADGRGCRPLPLPYAVP